MKKFILLLLIITTACSKSNQELPSTEIFIKNIYPKRIKLGDTITIEGENLNRAIDLNFNYIYPSYFIYNKRVSNTDFLTHSDIKATFKVPELHHEDITMSAVIGKGIKMDYYGAIRLKHKLIFNSYTVLNKKLAYACTSNKLFKSTDGLYSWEEIYTIKNTENISALSYLDNSNMWISTSDNKNIYIYHSTDNGKSFLKKITIKKPFSHSFIKKLHFFNNKNGYYVDSDNEMFFFDSKMNIKNVYEHFPSLNNLPFGKIEISNFTAINKDLIFLSPNSSPHLIKIENGQVSFSKFKSYASAPQFFDNIGYVKIGTEIHKSNDYGNTWTKVYDGIIHGVRFFTKDIGVIIKVIDWQNSITFYRTDDGGKTWTENSESTGKYIPAHPESSINYSWLFLSNIKYIE